MLHSDKETRQRSILYYTGSVLMSKDWFYFFELDFIQHAGSTEGKEVWCITQHTLQRLSPHLCLLRFRPEAATALMYDSAALCCIYIRDTVQWGGVLVQHCWKRRGVFPKRLSTYQLLWMYLTGNYILTWTFYAYLSEMHRNGHFSWQPAPIDKPQVHMALLLL